MPSGQYSVLTEGHYILHEIQQQSKICTVCHVSLLDPSVPIGDPQAGVCLMCREKTSSVVLQPHQQWQQSRIDQDTATTTYPGRQSSHEVLSSTRHLQDSATALEATHQSPPLQTPHSYLYSKRQQQQPSSNRYASAPRSSRTSCDRNESNHSHTVQHPPSQPKPTASTSLNPLVDITYLRHRPMHHQCLYAGAVFEGTQKSGRNSYDVHVTIADVNFAASTLCGYLRIRGLTDDWPELTTFFDAEIVGSRYGFITQNWGATRQEDIIHWNRFNAFKHVRPETSGPLMTMDDRDRGCIFMRWKERFLVPDHRVQDISGASFAGFYYVCVDLNPPPEPLPTVPHPPRSASHPAPLTHDSDMGAYGSFHGHTSDYSTLRMPSKDSTTRHGLPASTPPSPPAARMSGFYYHQNSEPYQQLQLVHVPEDTSSSFEFR